MGGGVKAPEMLIVNTDGMLWKADGTIVDVKQASNDLKDVGEVIIKPTIDTMGAKGVGLYLFVDGIDCRSGKTIEQVIKQYRSNFIIQKRVVNHETIRKLYPESINTFRIITFLTRDGIRTAPVTMRIGVGGKFVDNGGIFIGVSNTGMLNKEGFSKKHIQRYTAHPDSGVVFNGYRIEGVEKVLSAATKLHSMLPQLKMLSWDMTLDQDGNVMIIEVNTTAQSVWFPQMVTGKSIFGEYTGDMLELIK